MIKEECGIFGVFGLNEASRYVYLGLNFLQHRGQESCGIVSTDGVSLFKQVGLGKVSDFFDEQKIGYLEGFRSIGHVRYSTTGSPTLVNAQPITASTSKGAIAIAHNGNITNAGIIREELQKKGKIFHTTSDSEVIIQMIAEAPVAGLVDSVQWALSRMEGAFAILVLTKDTLIAARDPMGFRPLSMGRIGSSITEVAATVVCSSEDSGFTIVDGTKSRDINPNEMAVMTDSGVETREILPKKPKTNSCIFELIYFSKPSSSVFGKSVYDYRFEIGRRMAK